MNTTYIKKPDILKWYIYKILLIMRLTTVILMISMLQVSASTVAQEFNYVKKGASLIQIFKEIKKQTGYNIIWNEKKIDVTTKIDANFKKATIHDVLNKCLSNLSLSYSINDKMVMIKQEEPSFRKKLADFFKYIDVRGRVVGENNAPLVGATVKVKNNTRSTLTDDKGFFTLNNIEEESVLVISYMGYDTKEVKASENLRSISLILSTDKLQEVEINAGYYTVKDRERTGSISRLDANVIAQQPVSNPLQAMQNRIPGVEITQLTGVPGGGFKVQIRGLNNINTTSNDPLYVIDGVTYPSIKLNGVNSNPISQGVSPLSMINPNDIESIEVLKDADATAIYGSRGANGVILITTKTGSSVDLKINAGISHGFGEVANRIALMNTEQYLTMRTEAFKNDGLTPPTTEYDVNGVWDKNKYTNWQEKMIGGKANVTNIAVSISSGNKKSNYLISSNYYNEGTVFPGSFGFKRGGLHSNFTFGNTQSRFNASITTTYTRTTSNLLSTDLTQNIFWAPNAPDPYDQYGNLSWYQDNIPIGSNPMTTLFQTTDANTNNLVANINLGYRILSNLILNVSVGYTTLQRDELEKSPNVARNPASNPTSTNRSTLFGNNFNNTWIAEPQLNYEAKVGFGQLSALLGMSFQKNATEYRGVTASNFSSDELMDNISSASVFSIRESAYTTYKYAASYARINYAVFSKYFLNLTARRDGSSRFGPNKQFANFGAIGAAWVLSEEKLIKKNLPFLSFAKLRSSYGITGNDQIGDYQYLQLYTSAASYQGMPTLITARIANPNFGWQTNKKFEIAMQLGFLKDKLNLQIAYYRNRSSNQLVGQQLPPSVGASIVQANLPATVQNMGWEFDGSVNLLKKRDWDWVTSFNLTIPKNKLISYPNLSNPLYIIGKPLATKRYYNTTVDPQTGIYIFEDRDNNGIRNDVDLYLNKFIGQVFNGGLQNTLRFKQFNLDLLISFVKQNGNSLLSGINGAPGTSFNGTPTGNKPLVILERWQNKGDQTDIPKFTTINSTNFIVGTFTGSQSISDASFARLKNISVSYNLPKSMLNKLKLEAVRFEIQGQNILTATNYEGLDPENQALNRLPPLRTITLGIKLIL